MDEKTYLSLCCPPPSQNISDSFYVLYNNSNLKHGYLINLVNLCIKMTI